MTHVVVNGRTLHFGRKAAVHNLRTMRSALIMARALDDLGPPPYASQDWTKAVKDQNSGQWGMMGNDSIGDCVIADDGHYLMLRTANVGTIVVPTDAQIISQYSAVTGYVPGNESTDQGTSETQDSDYMVSTGLLGHKADATGMIDPNDLDHIKWGVALFGRVRLGINVTQYLMDQFEAAETWHYDATKDQAVLGGHDVPVVNCPDPKTGVVVTWGQEHPVDLVSFFAAQSGIVQESHADVFEDWIEQSGHAPSGFDRADLIAKLNSLSVGT